MGWAIGGQTTASQNGLSHSPVISLLSPDAPPRLRVHPPPAVLSHGFVRPPSGWLITLRGCTGLWVVHLPSGPTTSGAMAAGLWPNMGSRIPWTPVAPPRTHKINSKAP